MDRIIALYPTPDVAEHARTRLDMEGIPTDRLDVVSLEDQGRVVHLPDHSQEQDLAAYFHVLLKEESEWPLVDNIVEAICVGKAALVVHPRGKVEIDMVRPIIEGHAPETVFWRVAPEEAQGGILGEHAAGFKL
jgi:hypothetical protein